MFAFTYVRIAYDDYCWSIIRFAHALSFQIAAALPVFPIPLIYLLTVIPSEKLIEKYYRVVITTHDKFLKWREAFESKGLNVNLKKTKVMVSGSKGEVLKSKVDPCAKCGIAKG